MKQHLQEISQRVPKYLHFMREYATHLPDTSADKPGTTDVVEKLSEFVHELEQAQGKDVSGDV